ERPQQHRRRRRRPQQAGGPVPDARRARRRLRRHRHQPPLRPPRVPSAFLRRRRAARGDLRRPVPHHLVAAADGDGEVRLHRAPRRQPGGGRGAGLDGAGAARGPHAPGPVAGFHAGHRRGCAVLRRWLHHPGHLRALGGGGLEGHLAHLRRGGGPDLRRGAGRALPRAVPGHPPDGRGVRAGDGAVVFDPRPPRDRPDRRGAGGFRRRVAPPRGPVRPGPPLRRLHRARLRRAGRDRGGGALRRHGALRPPAHRARLDRLRAAGAGAELPGAGGAAALRPQGHRKPLLPPGAGVAAPAAGGAGDGRHHHRLAIHDLGRLLHRPAMRATRLPAALGGDAHQRNGRRPNLPAADQRRPAAGRADPGGVLPHLRQPGRGLRHRRHRHLRLHQLARRPGVPPAVRLVRPAGRRGVHAAPGARPRLLRLQRAQDPGRRLGAGGAGRRLVHAHAHLEAGARAALHPVPPGQPAAEILPRAVAAIPHRAGARHRRVHDRPSGLRARRPAAQPQAQQGPARAGDLRHRAQRGRPGDPRKRPAGGAGAGAQHPPGHRPLRLPREPQHPTRAGSPARGRRRVPADAGELLPRPRNPGAGGGAQDGALAAVAVRRDGAQRRAGDRILPHPLGPGGGAGRPGRDL
ncbi:MAG: Kup system potassium uptake protein, partial [uncultured Acetobacteraceae bacterium]